MRRITAGMLFVVVLSAWTAWDLTTEVTKAPFDVTSTVVQPTSDFTSSTSPGAQTWNGPAMARQRVERFVASSSDSIRADIAKGGGEYLTSLSTLAGVPASSHGHVGTALQRTYAELYDPTLSSQETWTRVVDAAWSAGYGRRQPISPTGR